jgi:CRISPR/Cas system Type II protein with McrA/HNH and RuvC-like nuclease domain
MVLKLIEQQNYRCALSGRPLTPETASLDHIVPLSRGGKHDISNLWIVDHQVNNAKGTFTVEEFIALCHDVVTHQNASDITPSAIGTSEN